MLFKCILPPAVEQEEPEGRAQGVKLYLQLRAWGVTPPGRVSAAENHRSEHHYQGEQLMV